MEVEGHEGAALASEASAATAAASFSEPLGLVRTGDLGFWAVSGHGSWAVVVGNDLFERLDRGPRSFPPPPTIGTIRRRAWWQRGKPRHCAVKILGSCMLRAAWREVRGQEILGEFGIQNPSVFLCHHTPPKLRLCVTAQKNRRIPNTKFP